MMTIPRRITGTLWLMFGIGFLAADLLELRHRDSLGIMYSLVLWGYLSLCIVAGAVLFGPVPLGRWLVTAVATSLALYAVLLWLEAEGPPLWAKLWLSVMLLFSVWSIYLVQRRAA
jgi:hypothetical protein